MATSSVARCGLAYCALLALYAVALTSGQQQDWTFQHGVASGDPLPDRVVLWTRVSWTGAAAAPPSDNVELTVEVAKSQDMSAEPKSYKVTCTAAADWTCKLDADGLSPAVKYFYRFTAPGGVRSPVGRFHLPYPRGLNVPPSQRRSSAFPAPSSRRPSARTFQRFAHHTHCITTQPLPHSRSSPLPPSSFSSSSTQPTGDARQGRVRLAVFSCSNWGWGYFHAYGVAATYELDAWVHLGDFIYEYGPGDYPRSDPNNPASNQAVRFGLKPANEILTITDYRQRYALYRTDSSLQALSAAAPTIAIWDDHETANNAWKDGFPDAPSSQNNITASRRAAGVQAWHEWLPVRPSGGVGSASSYTELAINRTLNFGSTLSLFLTEDRLQARSSPPYINGALYSSAGSLGAAVGGVAPSKWGPAEEAKILAVKAQADAFANDPNRTILGKPQVSWLKQQNDDSAAAGVTWQLFAVTTIMQDILPNPPAAIAAANASGDAANAAFWGGVWANCSSSDVAVVNGTPTNAAGIHLYSTACYRRPYIGAELKYNLSDRTPGSPTGAGAFAGLVGGCRAIEASSRYNVILDFDAWQGFRAERDELLDIAADSNNAVFIAGDSHVFWASVLKKANGEVVAAEFDVSSVSSVGFEELFPFMPVDMLAASLVAGGGFRGGLRYANTDRKGFIYLAIDGEKQHADYIGIDDHCTPAGINSSFCMAGFDRYTSIERAKRGLPNDLQRTSCLTEAERVSGIVAAPPVPAYRRMGCSSYNGAKPTVFAFASGSTQLVAHAARGQSYSVEQCATAAHAAGMKLFALNPSRTRCMGSKKSSMRKQGKRSDAGCSGAGRVPVYAL
ncbi:hypothetical protein CHLRE_05g239850v5 [Chlamydomonas reinhardtii]|uniref:Alkaline phosphatase n=1 Tax=Chlamydomonas reinhardtii TaxID=3055 RepID=A0A2K3DT46_CHLRE|nr:uncharacterized protein CHLRE_05g239850v5 [Chlamydomonas reinhardtii]PNW83701.1 hypothetical protein CHLRE_05g239850v5 [Chlamydomonas reinhardtii]